jgi:hypothetical protein
MTLAILSRFSSNIAHVLKDSPFSGMSQVAVSRAGFQIMFVFSAEAG